MLVKCFLDDETLVLFFPLCFVITVKCLGKLTNWFFQRQEFSLIYRLLGELCLILDETYPVELVCMLLIVPHYQLCSLKMSVSAGAHLQSTWCRSQDTDRLIIGLQQSSMIGRSFQTCTTLITRRSWLNFWSHCSGLCRLIAASLHTCL